MEELIIKERQVRKDFADIVNKSQLPAFILLSICKDLLSELEKEEHRQFNIAYEHEQQKLKEEQEKKEKEEKKGDDDNGND